MLQSKIITVSGQPGTGTSTLCKLLQKELGWDYIYAGQLFRDEAKARGLTLAQFGALCESDPSIDKSLDTKQAELLAKSDGLILEGRMSGVLATDVAPHALRVKVFCTDEERYRRISERDGGGISTVKKESIARVKSEKERYFRYYGVDPDDPRFYDQILDSTALTPAELVAEIMARLSLTS